MALSGHFTPSGYKKSFSAVQGDHKDFYKPRIGVILAVFPAPADGNGVAMCAAGMQPTSPSMETTIHEKQHLFFDIPAAQAFGFPLQLASSPPFGGTDAHNQYIEALFLDPDASSPAFGQSLWDKERAKGSAVVIRKDLKPLHFVQVKAAISFCSMVMQLFKTDVGNVTEATAKESLKHDLAARFINAEAFRRFFEDMKKAEKDDIPKAWEAVDCPV